MDQIVTRIHHRLHLDRVLLNEGAVRLDREAERKPGLVHVLRSLTLAGIGQHVVDELPRKLSERLLVDPGPPLVESDWAAVLEPGEALPAVLQPHEPVGCVECRRTGYLGRVGLYELLPITPALRRLFHADMNLASFTAGTRAEGMRTLRRAALEKVAEGITTIEEVRAVLPPRE